LARLDWRRRGDGVDAAVARVLQKFRGYFIIPPRSQTAKARAESPETFPEIMHQNRRKPPATQSQSLDKYYTKRAVARKCLAVVGDMPHQYDLVVEPSAGDGAFYDEIAHPNKFGIDIDPAHKKIIKADWLKFNVPGQYGRVLVVGNPPFGMYHKLSSAFISHALSFGNVQTIAFILPNVYRKHTRQKILPPAWRIVSITELERDAYLLDGKDYHVPSSFFVFDKSTGADLRVDPNLYTETGDFSFGNKHDFDVFVFGSSPAKITMRPKPNNRGHFLKAKIPVPELVEKIKRVQWEGNSCASGGVYWLTKYEFLHQYVKRHG